MRKIWGLIFIVGMLLFSNTEAQNINTSEIVTVEGKKYVLHQVEQGETIFSICKKFKVDQKELVNTNPQLIFGLKQGDSIKVPYRLGDIKKRNETVQNKDLDFQYHVVKKSETIYSISKQYNVPISSIYRFNPEAEVEVLENEIIRIPLKIIETESDGLIRQDADYFYHKVRAQENLYSLARRYDAKVGDILTLNPSVSEGLDIGMIIKIPKLGLAQVEIESVEKTGEFFLHRIEMGDTFYSYQRRFGIGQQKLVELNPELIEGLVAGQIIKVPSGRIPKIEVIPVNVSDFIQHIVGKGETLYGISKQYDEKILIIKDLNPELKTRGLIAGETILIPKPLKKQEIVNIDSVANEPGEEILISPEVIFEIEDQKQLACSKEYSVLNDDTFRISMFLPLFYDKNDTLNLVKKSDEEIASLDSLKSIDESVLEKYYKIEIDTITFIADTILVDSLEVKELRSLFSSSKFYSRDFVNFYQGLLLAIDSMQSAGARVELTLYDSEYDQSVIDSILTHNDFINADLIVGPVDVRLQKNISDFSYKNQIPLVSPLSSNDALLLENPFYFQVIPSKDYIIRKTSDYISDEFFESNFIVMTLGNTSELKENNLVKLIRDNFFSAGIYNNLDEVRFTQVDFSKGGNLGYWQVKKTLKPDMENVIFIPASDNRNEREAMLSQAINSLQVLSQEFDITLIGLSDYPKFESIYTEYYHRLKLHYLTPDNIDYTDLNVNRFIQKYREHFYNEPDLYAYRGYDVAFFFIGAYEKFGKNFSECIGAYNPSLLQSEFNFQKVEQFSGYMNHTLYIKNYTSDYNVEVISKITEGRVVLK